MNRSATAAPFAAIVFLARGARLFAGTLVVILSALTISAPLDSRPAQTDRGLTAHEWGTFTTIAGADGQPVDWVPIKRGGTPDLPSFVEHFRSADFKSGLSGIVRMETPVIYFYSTHEANVSVHVSFAKGLITEWYPHAASLSPSDFPSDLFLYQPHQDGDITWDSVAISPALAGKFPRETAASHYYAARNTAAIPLSVKGPSGDQAEKFLFYRGVSTISLPLSAKVLSSGAIELDNRTGQRIPAVILFERRGDKLGYRIVTSPQDHTILETPSVSGTFDSLRTDLEDILVAQGLFHDEARAMIETWRDSWFEEGSRLFYIVPRPFVDSVLPLSINPAPAQIVRAFVGRIELVTPATARAIEAALAAHDRAALRKYGRFFDPLFNIILAKQSDPARKAQMLDEIGAAYR